MELLALASIVGWGFFIRSRNPSLNGFAPFVAICLAVSFLFISGLAQLLKPGVVLLVISGAFFFLKFLLTLIQSVLHKIKKVPMVNPPSCTESVVFLCLSLAWYVWTKNSFVFGWDEFFWGQFTKAIYFDSKFYNSTGPILISHYRYPPGMPLWQYFFTAFGPFKENALHLANGLFTMSAFTALLTYESKARIANFIKTLVFLYILTAFASGFSTLLADFLIGICFGLGLILLFKIKDLKDILWFIPVIWFFSYIKQTGIVFSVFLAVGVVILNYHSLVLRRALLRPVFFLFVLVQSTLPYFLWKWYLSWTPDTGTLFNPERILNSETFGKITANLPLSLAIIRRFLTDLRGTNLLNALGTPLRTYSFAALMALFLLILALSKWVSPEILPKKYKQYIAVIFLVCCAWLGVHLLSYLMIFPDKEGIQMASFERYMSTFIIGMGMLTIYYYGEALRTPSQNIKKVRAIQLVGVFLVSLPWAQPLDTLILTNKPEETAAALRTLKIRESLDKSLSIISQNTPPSSRIWLVYQDSNGQEAMLMRFLASPHRINAYAWSWGKRYGPHDQWTHDASTEEIRRILSKDKADFLYVAHADKDFWNRYKDLFEPTSVFADNTIFKISLDPEAKYFFQYIEPK